MWCAQEKPRTWTVYWSSYCNKYILSTCYVPRSFCVYSIAKSCPAPWDHMELLPIRLLCPWDFSGKNTGVGCHFLLQGDFLTQGLNPHLLLDRSVLYLWATREAPESRFRSVQFSSVAQSSQGLEKVKSRLLNSQSCFLFTFLFQS